MEIFKINLKRNNVLTFSEAEAIYDIYQQIGDKWKDHIYPKSELEKNRSNTLKVTILKEDNQTEKSDCGSRWRSQYRKSPKRKIIDNPRSVPSRSSTSKEKREDKKETGLSGKPINFQICEPLEKHSKIEQPLSFRKRSNDSSVKDSKLPDNVKCGKNERFSPIFLKKEIKTKGYVNDVDLDDNDSDIQFVEETRGATEIADKFANSVDMDIVGKLDKATNTEDDLKQTWIFQGLTFQLLHGKWGHRDDDGRLITLEMNYEEKQL